MRVDKICKIIYFGLISSCNFIIGVNTMYCIDNPEVGLWRIPFMVIGLIALDAMSYPIMAAETIVTEKEGA